MQGEVINCSAHHKDIYFLKTNANNTPENANLVNLFASPAGREMFKYKSMRPKLKQKLNPAMEFFIQNKSTSAVHNNSAAIIGDNNKVCSLPASTDPHPQDRCKSSRRSSLDLYEEAASILGLTCSQTDDCKCIECQCHYFDFDDEIEYPSGECVVDHSSSCTIQ